MGRPPRRVRESWRRRGERCGVTTDHHTTHDHTADHDPSDDATAHDDSSDVSPHCQPGGRYHAHYWCISLIGGWRQLNDNYRSAHLPQRCPCRGWHDRDPDD
jgi:hypothetical protein